MPKLPSGRHVGIQCLTPEEIIKKVSCMHPEASLLSLGMKVKEFDSIEAIKPFVSVLFVREASNSENQKLDRRSQAIPEDAEPYDSGFTLADLEQFTANWTLDDKQAFADFLGSEKVKSYFQDVLNQMHATGHWYQQNLLDMMNAACEGTTDNRIQ